MAFHPRDRSPWNRQMNRRDMLKLSGSAALSAYALAACGGGESRLDSSSGGIRIGTPRRPVRQPLFDDNPAIESDLEPEPGPLRIYNWADYIWTPVLKDFAKKFRVDYELTTFYNLEEATRKMRTGQIKFDVFFPTGEIIPKFVAGKLLQPLNHDYLPALEDFIWPELVNPYYDKGSRYTVPYVVYQTGVGWRNDLVKADPEAFENPWEALWDPAHKSVTGFYDDYRETIGVGMYRSGITDINSATEEGLEAAKNNLLEAVQDLNARFSIDGAYVKLPEGKLAIQHAWNGDLINAQYYAPKGQDPAELRYLWPPKTTDNRVGGYVSNDAMAIPSNAEHPVLAHMFLNYLLEDLPALKNFSWLGYQPPQTSLDPSTLVRDGWVPENLASAIVTKDDFALGQVPIQLTPAEDAAWLEAWSDIQAGG